MKEKFRIVSRETPDVILKTILPVDCENLRIWKNQNHMYFFFQDLITPEMQQDWFGKYLDRENDYMFMVDYEGNKVGCIGFRMIEDAADIYNVILGIQSYGKKGLMSQALRLMCSFIHTEFSKNITLKVLKENPAVSWYIKNSFLETASHEKYLDLKYDDRNFRPVVFQRIVND